MAYKMNDFKINQIWINGPRFLIMLILIMAVIGKINSPDIFFTITNSINLPNFMPEALFSIVISLEFTLILLLIINPTFGLFLSGVTLTISTIFIFWLYLTGFTEMCGIFGDFMLKEIGPSKILQNIGLILLLFSSWSIRKSLEV